MTDQDVTILDEDDELPRLGSFQDPNYSDDDVTVHDDDLEGSVMQGYDPNDPEYGNSGITSSSRAIEDVVGTVAMGVPQTLAVGQGMKLAGKYGAPALTEFLAKYGAERAAPAIAKVGGGLLAGDLYNRGVANPIREAVGAEPVSGLANIPNSLIDVGTQAALSKALPDESLEGAANSASGYFRKKGATRLVRAITTGESSKNFKGDILGNTALRPFFQSDMEAAARVALDDDFIKGYHGLSTEGLAKRVRSKIQEYGPQIDKVAKRVDTAIGERGISISRDDLLNIEVSDGVSLSKYLDSLEADQKAKQFVEQEIGNVTTGLFGKSGNAVNTSTNTTAQRLLDYKRKVANVTDFGGEDAFSQVRNETRRLINLALDRKLEQEIARAPEVGDSLAKEFADLNSKVSSYFTLEPEVSKLAAHSKSQGLGQSIGELFSRDPRGALGTAGAIGAAGLAAGVPFGQIAGMATIGAGIEGSLPSKIAKTKLTEWAANHATPGVIRQGLAVPLAASVKGYMAAENAGAEEPDPNALPPGPAQRLPVLFPQNMQPGSGVPQNVDPFSQGLPRSTDRFDGMALQRFMMATSNRPTSPIAQQLGQKFEEAIRSQDRGKQQRLVADMAKLFPDVFEPGLGVDDKLYYPDDQAEYMSTLKSAQQKGLISSIFLAKQSNAFADKNDSSILPVEHGIKQQSQVQASRRKNTPPKDGEPRQYTY